MTNLVTLLACLSMIESGDNDLKVGKHGERSRYQITRAAWKECRGYIGRGEFENLSKNPDQSKYTAIKIIEHRTEAFKTLFHRDPTPFETYILWNAPAQIGHPSKVVAEKAQRFENLVKDKMKGGK
jgi:hypothetical protein